MADNRLPLYGPLVLRGNKIEGLADGEASSDAVNLSQLEGRLETGATFPTTPSSGDVFQLTANVGNDQPGVYVYDGSDWNPNLPRLDVGSVWTWNGSKYIEEKIEVVGLYDADSPLFTATPDATYPALSDLTGTSDSFEEGDIVRVTALANKRWLVTADSSGYVEANFSEITIGDNEQQNLVINTSSDQEREDGRWPTTEAWQEARFALKSEAGGIDSGPELPTTGDIGDLFSLTALDNTLDPISLPGLYRKVATGTTDDHGWASVGAGTLSNHHIPIGVGNGKIQAATVNVTGRYDEHSVDHTFADQAAFEADTTTVFTHRQIIFITDTSVYWYVETAGAGTGYQGAANYTDVTDSDQVQNLIENSGSAVFDVAGRWPTTEAWQKENFAPIGTVSSGDSDVTVNSGALILKPNFTEHGPSTPAEAAHFYSPEVQQDVNTGDNTVTDVSIQIDQREILPVLQEEVRQILEELSNPGGYTWVEEDIFEKVFLTNRTNSSGTLDQTLILQPHFVDTTDIFTTYAVLTGTADTGDRSAWNGASSATTIIGIGPDVPDLIAFQLISTFYRDTTAAGLAEIRLKMIDPDGEFAGPSRVGTNTNKQQFISWISDNDGTDANPIVHSGVSTYYYETDNDFLDTIRHDPGSHITGSSLTADERELVDGAIAVGNNLLLAKDDDGDIVGIANPTVSASVRAIEITGASLTAEVDSGVQQTQIAFSSNADFHRFLANAGAPTDNTGSFAAPAFTFFLNNVSYTVAAHTWVYDAGGGAGYEGIRWNATHIAQPSVDVVNETYARTETSSNITSIVEGDNVEFGIVDGELVISTNEATDISEVEADITALETQIQGSNVWQAALRNRYIAGQTVRDSGAIVTQGNITSDQYSIFNGQGPYALSPAPLGTAVAGDITFAYVDGSTPLTVASIDQTANTVLLSDTPDRNFTLTYPPTNFGAPIGVSTRQYIRNNVPYDGMNDVEEPVVALAAGDFNFIEAQGVYQSAHWIAILINGEAWREHQIYLRGDVVDFIDVSSIPRLGHCGIFHTATNANAPFQSDAIQHEANSTFSTNAPWEPIGSAIDVSMGQQQEQDQIDGSDGNPVAILGRGSASGRWFVTLGQGISGVILPGSERPNVGDNIAFGLNNESTSENYELVEVTNEGVSTFWFEGDSVPAEITTLVTGVGNVVHLFVTNLRTDLGQIDRFIFNADNFVINTDNQNIGHAHISLAPTGAAVTNNDFRDGGYVNAWITSSISSLTNRGVGTLTGLQIDTHTNINGRETETWYEILGVSFLDTGTADADERTLRLSPENSVWTDLNPDTDTDADLRLANVFIFTV